MTYHIKQTFEEIKIRSYVYAKIMDEIIPHQSSIYGRLVTGKYINNFRKKLMIEWYMRFNPITGEHFDPTQVNTFEIDYEENYEYTCVDSNACIEFCKNESNNNPNSNVIQPDDEYILSYAWTACEQMYGINHLDYKGKDQPIGSNPLRELAFAILKNDPIALDIAKDILKI